LQLRSLKARAGRANPRRFQNQVAATIALQVVRRKDQNFLRERRRRGMNIEQKCRLARVQNAGAGASFPKAPIIWRNQFLKT
jgi:hypothetical protein